MPKIDTSFDMPSTSEVEGYYANDNTVENHLRFEYASSRPHLGGFSFASAGRTLRGATQVQVNGTHEGAVAAVCQGRHHQSSAVPQVLIPVLYLSVHHAHWDAQVVRVIVQVLAAAQTVRQDKHIKVHIGSQHSHRTAGLSQEATSSTSASTFWPWGSRQICSWQRVGHQQLYLLDKSVCCVSACLKAASQSPPNTS